MAERAAPTLTDATTDFWTGGEHGELRICRCRSCRRWIHPPAPVCRSCGGREIVPEATSGQGTVWAFTINRHQWSPVLDPPYVLAEVELREQPGLRLLTALVGCGEITNGMPVSVRFEQAGETWVPVFGP